MTIPTSWTLAGISTIGKLVGGKTPSKSNPAFWVHGTIPWVSPKDMKRFEISDSEDLITEQAVSSGGMNLLPANSILIVTRSGILAHTLPVAITTREVTINQDLKAIAPSPAFCSRYLAYAIRAKSRDVLATCTKAGTTVASVETTALELMPLPLAPLHEQQRIADKLDISLARVDAVNDRLARVGPMLKRFRQAVLTAATSGRLTVDWRGGTGANWQTLSADEACDKVQSGGTPKSGFTTEGIPFLKVYNIVDQRVDFDYRPQFVSPDVHASELKKSQVLPGDVLMNIVGPPLCKVAVVPPDHAQWNINQAITLFRPSDKVSSGWLYVVLCEGQQVRDVLKDTKGSVGQVNISLSQCRSFRIPIPGSEEQSEIVRRVNVLFAFADRLEARLQAAQTAASRLTPSLLAKAFRGELVPQDPTDEPATELLKRLADAQSFPVKKGKSRKAAVSAAS